MKTQILMLLFIMSFNGTATADMVEDIKESESYYNLALDKFNQWKETRSPKLLNEMIEALNHALETEPIERSKTGIYFKRGAAYGLLGDTDKCIEDFTRGLEIEPKNAYGRKTRGCQYLVKGEVQKAREDFEVVCSMTKESEACRWIDAIDKGECDKVCKVQE